MEDVTERCEASDTMGNQCELHLGHAGLHSIRWNPKYWKHDYSKQSLENWRTRKRLNIIAKK